MHRVVQKHHSLLAVSSLMTLVAGRAARALGGIARAARSVYSSKTYTICPVKLCCWLLFFEIRQFVDE